MSTYSPQTDAAATTDARVAIVTAEWNTHITSRLRDEAVEILAEAHAGAEGRALANLLDFIITRDN